MRAVENRLATPWRASAKTGWKIVLNARGGGCSGHLLGEKNKQAWTQNHKQPRQLARTDRVVRLFVALCSPFADQGWTERVVGPCLGSGSRII